MIPDYKNARNFATDTDLAEDERSLGTIYITGGGVVNYPFKGISPESKFGWQEMVWKKEPTRSGDYSFSNLDSTKVGLIARCEINFKYLDYNDYVVLRNIVNRERHFLVKYFDTDENAWVTRDMYCSKNERGKLFTLNRSIIGQFDYVIEFVGTGLDDYYKTTYNIRYNADGVSNQTASWGDQVTIANGDSLTGPSGESFKGWTKTEGSGIVNYQSGQNTTIWHDLNLYPVWEA